MALQFTIKVDDSQAQAILAGASKFRDLMRWGLTKAGAVLLGEIKDRTPVDTGGLKASTRLSVTVNSQKAEAVVSASKDYAAAVETGTKGPRKPPPAAALYPWVRRNIANPDTGKVSKSIAATLPQTKFGKPKKAALRDAARWAVVRAIQRHIAIHGTRGRHMFEQGTEAARNRVEAVLKITGNLIAEKLGGNQ